MSAPLWIPMVITTGHRVPLSQLSPAQGLPPESGTGAQLQGLCAELGWDQQRKKRYNKKEQEELLSLLCHPVFLIKRQKAATEIKDSGTWRQHHRGGTQTARAANRTLTGTHTTGVTSSPGRGAHSPARTQPPATSLLPGDDTESRRQAASQPQTSSGQQTGPSRHPWSKSQHCQVGTVKTPYLWPASTTHR